LAVFYYRVWPGFTTGFGPDIATDFVLGFTIGFIRDFKTFDILLGDNAYLYYAQTNFQCRRAVRTG
jgi:hypothetical protein